MIVNTIGPLDAQIMLVGEAPGEDEAACGQPFVGYAGRTLKQLVASAGIIWDECLVSNVARERPPANKIALFFQDKKQTLPKENLQGWINQLKYEIETYRPNIVIALGGTALWALTGEKGIKTFRGTLLESTLVPNVKVLPTFHPQAVNYSWKLFHTVLMDLRKALFESSFPDIKPSEHIFSVSPPKAEILDYLAMLLEKQDELTIAIDLEHSNPGAHISWLGISHAPNFGMAIQFLNGHASCFPENDELEVWQAVARVLASDIKQVYHNASYDVANLWYNMGIECKNVYFDTIIASHALWPEAPKDLGYLCSILLNVPAWKHTSQGFTKGEYNAADAANTRALFDVLQKLIFRDPNAKLIFDREMELLEPVAMMQLQGIHIDTVERDRLIGIHQAKRAEIQEGLSEILEKEINFDSPKQLQQLLYIDLALPIKYKRRKSINDARKITTDAEALKKLYTETKNPILKLILAYRKHTKLLQFLNVKLSPEGKVHTSYNITGTTTGRWSSSESIILSYGSGNLQNISYIVRSMYVPRKGLVLLQADYIQAEAVVVAYLINDIRLKQAFANGDDIHKLTAQMLFGGELEDITKEQRDIGKAVRHSSNYAAGPAVIANKLQCAIARAKIFLSTYHNACPQLRIWHQEIQNQLRKNRTLITPLGRKRVFTERWGDSLFRGAYAFVPQSTVGDLLNISLGNFYRRWGKEVDILLQLHDAIYIACPEKDVLMWKDRLRDTMIWPIHVNHEEMIIDVDFKVGPNWGEMEKLK